MRSGFTSVAMLMFLLCVTAAVRAQTGAQTGAQAGSATAAASPADTSVSRAGALPVSPAKEAAGNVPVPDKRTARQKALASQADRLVDMANELKAQVDLTNKNILSLKVVEKAQEIEAFAKGIKDQAKRNQ